ncbi:TonB-dependent receptor domain-containing protein [Aquimarina muelleri]|uniref:TonB-dependent receptor n=1 Tax=Aquimarina muelleri TaxID=279356 RepID=UPI003F68827B
MRKTFTVIALFFIGAIFAQETGTIAGKLLDKESNNQPLPFANVVVKGTAKGSSTDFDGLFEITGVPAGTYTLEFSFTGYQTVEIPNVVVQASKVVVVDATMGATAAALEEVVIKVVTSREREEALLIEQKQAVTQKTSIGAEELSKKGVGNVASAVAKVTGISKQEGSGNVFVRGLGDRYNITTLNGLPLPSNDPSKKNIQLEIFNTDIVESIGIDKTYDLRNYGDFAGANIDITSKKYKGNGFIEISLETGLNTITVGANDFFLTDGPNSTGFYDINVPQFPLSNYNFTTSWDRQKTSVPINSGISLKGGDSFYIFGGETKLRMFGVGSFNNSYSYIEGISRGGVTVNSVANSDFDYFNYTYSTNTTLMGNIGLNHKNNDISYNVFFLNTSNEQQKEFFGIIDIEDDASEGGGFIQRAVFERTSLITHQLLGDHEISDNFLINWGGSYNFLKSSEPNRRQVTLVPDVTSEPNGPRSFRLVSAASDNHRFYSELIEEEVAVNFSSTFKFKKNKEEKFDGKIILGYNGRFKNVDFEATQFNFQIFSNNREQPIVDLYNVDAYFNQENLDRGLYRINTFRGAIDVPNALDPQFYGGKQSIHAGYINIEYAFSPKFTMLAGVRAEQINQSIEWSTSLDPQGDKNELDSFEILPAISLKYKLNQQQNLKFAASKTYTLPQYKERAPFLFQQVNQDYLGNQNLSLSTDYNVDLKWELFPKSSEIISLGIFGKHIENPINSIIIQSASNDITWANTGEKAIVYGAELELKKVIFENETSKNDIVLKNNLTAGLNAAYMITNQDLDGEKVLKEANVSFIPTYTKTDISGASDLVANADVSYYKDFSKNKSIQLTMAVNYFSDRIYALGNFGKGNIVEKGVPTLDFIAKTELTKHITLGLSAKNLLNPSVERFQESVNGETNNDPILNLNFQKKDITVLSYKKGYDLKLSLSYKF